MKKRCTGLVLIFLYSLVTLPSQAAETITLTDDTGHTITLAQPAKRIISLAPHITEVLFAAGAGAYVAGAVSYSDYPEAARSIPLIGSYNNIDLEAVIALHPDLIIAWGSGNRKANLQKLKALGIPVYINDPHTLDDIAKSIEKIGRLTGAESTAQAVATDFRIRKQTLQTRYAHRPVIRMFYQIWHQPLMTVNGTHVISEVMRLCGGENIFASLPQTTPHITTEAVLAANPTAIIASGMDIARPEWLDDWKRWPQLSANQHGALFFIPPDLMQRYTPRILDGATELCTQLESIRTDTP